MNPIRPLLRTALRARTSSSVAAISRRTLVTPTSPAQAKVSEVSLDQRVVEDPGEFEEGDHVAGQSESGEGTSILWSSQYLPRFADLQRCLGSS